MKLKTLVCLSLITLVASLSAAAYAQTYTTFSLDGGTTPEAGVTIKGDFAYATAALGGGGGGQAVEVKHLGIINDFEVGDSPGPEARVVFGPDGHLYGSFTGGSSNGFIFNLIPNPTICKTAQCQAWRLTVLHQFQGFPSDGAHSAHGDLTWDQLGNIYGTTTVGGSKEYGVVYELMPPVPPSKTWTESVIWNFTGPDGENPQNAVTFDSSGNLLGTAKQGGANGFGTVFKLIPSGNTWTETNVYDFQGGTDGKSPIAGLMIDSSGNIYGATSDGGSGGGGTVFELIPSGNTYTFSLLYSFSGMPGSNCGPWGTLTMDAAGSLYDTTYCGGLHGEGSVFKLNNTQNGWVYTSFHDFPASEHDGLLPISNVTFDANNNLWGTVSRDTGVNTGFVWMIKP